MRWAGTGKIPIRAHARVQAELPRTSRPVIREAIKAETLRVDAAVYDLATGTVLMVSPSHRRPP